MTRQKIAYGVTTCLLAWMAVYATVGAQQSAVGPGKLRDRAERFFRGVYGGDSSVVDELASDKIVISYPIFDRLYKSPTIRGRDGVKQFAARFSSKWTDTKVTIHEAVVEGNKVVLLWSFQARFVSTDQKGQARSPLKQWGGISYFRFDNSGSIEQEIGEESEPGPFGRLIADAKVGQDG